MNAGEHTSGPCTLYIEPVLSPILASMELSRLVDGTKEFSGQIPMLVGSDGLCVALTGCGPKGPANARRLVACWNACEATPTEVLETLKGGRLLSRMAGQRDDLFSVLQEILDEGYNGPGADRARAAIAKATGSAT